MNLLIIYGTTEGQTRKIAQYMQTEGAKSGQQVQLCDASDNPQPPQGYDLVLIGSSIHMHKYHNAVVHYVKKNVEALNKMRTGFFTVCLAVMDPHEETQKELQEVIDGFLDNTGWKPTAIEKVAGALKYTQYDFFKKLIMRMISKKEGGNTDTSHDYEYTDWTKVKAFLEKMLAVPEPVAEQ